MYGKRSISTDEAQAKPNQLIKSCQQKRQSNKHKDLTYVNRMFQSILLRERHVSNAQHSLNSIKINGARIFFTIFFQFGPLFNGRRFRFPQTNYCPVIDKKKYTVFSSVRAS